MRALAVSRRVSAFVVVTALSSHVSPAQSLGSCGLGTVGSSVGGPFDVVRINGSVGGADRRIDVLTGQPFSLDVATQPGEATAAFALFLTAGVPGPADVAPLPFGIGDMCFAPTTVLVPSATAPWNVNLGGVSVVADLTIQGLMVDPTQPFPVSITNGLIVRAGPCGTSAPVHVSTSTTGSAAATGHYALAMRGTINDPDPKLIGPGHLFTPGQFDKIRLAPLGTPGVATHDYTWSGGDEVGWFRGRMAVDGSTPGIDRIFFVARNTSGTPNFVDWDGTAFSNETTLTAASGSIQRLWTKDDGDLMGNDFFGNVYVWDKQNGYARTQLFQFTNNASSVPWGSSLDLGLGQPAYDPVSELVLLPIDNDAISQSGQLYGFDLSGNRVFVDQDLMGTLLDGSGSTDFGVTVDLQNPTCRVLAHGGKNGGSMFIARFTGGMGQKNVTALPSPDSSGGWQGVLFDGEFWTNTNNASYGAVRRLLPTDW